MIRVNNPIATAEQHAIERRAVELRDHPTLLTTRAGLKQYWLDEIQPRGPMRECFEWAFEEVMFGAVVWSLNQDPLYPGVVTITRLPHRLGALEIPGSRWGIDNPDSVYRVIPISGDEEYVIRGRVPERRLVENYFTLWDHAMGTVDNLDGKALEVDADGAFEITVSSAPANGRANHVQSSPEAKEFYIRDVIFDWAADRPNELSIERVGAAPSRPPFSEAEQIDLTARYMRSWVTNTIRWNSRALEKPANAFDYRLDSDRDGALRNQIYVLSKFELPSREHALIFTVNLGGARYFLAPITNFWGTTNDIVHRTGSLNLTQAVANPDGTYTFVLAMQDPGVWNWLDPSGLPEGVLTLRWAEFPDGRPSSELSVSSEVVPLERLERHLPEGTRLVSPEEREAQLRERAASYQWRLQDE